MPLPTNKCVHRIAQIAKSIQMHAAKLLVIMCLSSIGVSPATAQSGNDQGGDFLQLFNNLMRKGLEEAQRKRQNDVFNIINRTTYDKRPSSLKQISGYYLVNRHGVFTVDPIGVDNNSYWVELYFDKLSPYARGHGGDVGDIYAIGLWNTGTQSFRYKTKMPNNQLGHCSSLWVPKEERLVAANNDDGEVIDGFFFSHSPGTCAEYWVANSTCNLHSCKRQWDRKKDRSYLIRSSKAALGVWEKIDKKSYEDAETKWAK